MQAHIAQGSLLADLAVDLLDDGLQLAQVPAHQVQLPHDARDRLGSCSYTGVHGC